MRTNLEDRNGAIDLIGEEEFYAIPENDKYRGLPVPSFFAQLFSWYLEMDNMSGESLTWGCMESWSNLRDIQLTQYEIDTVLKMHSWASSERYKLREDKPEKKADDEEDKESEEED